MPNLVQVAVGESVADGPEAGRPQPIALLEANLDDVSGEVVAHATEALLADGALDAWTTAVTMKKGRPGVVVSVLAGLADVARLRDMLATETGTLGVRVTELGRWPYARLVDEVDVAGMLVRVKRSARRLKAEYDDAARVARVTGIPLRDVIARAEAEARGDSEIDDPDQAS
jgi:uncharacterized protein (DUF111 family)